MIDHSFVSKLLFLDVSLNFRLTDSHTSISSYNAIKSSTNYNIGQLIGQLPQGCPTAANTASLTLDFLNDVTSLTALTGKLVAAIGYIYLTLAIPFLLTPHIRIPQHGKVHCHFL
jgi:hypothetical protein